MWEMALCRILYMDPAMLQVPKVSHAKFLLFPEHLPELLDSSHVAVRWHTNQASTGVGAGVSPLYQGSQCIRLGLLKWLVHMEATTEPPSPAGLSCLGLDVNCLPAWGCLCRWCTGSLGIGVCAPCSGVLGLWRLCTIPWGQGAVRSSAQLLQVLS